MGDTSVQDMHSGYAVFDGVDAVVERRIHNPEVEGSWPPPATR